MKSKTTKILALTAALCGLQLFTATTAQAANTPLVVWNGDLANNSAKNGFTMTFGSNAAASSGSAVLTAKTSGTGNTGVAIDWENTTFSGQTMTVLVKYSGFSQSSLTGNTALLGTYWGSSNKSTETLLNANSTQVKLAYDVTSSSYGNSVYWTRNTLPSTGLLRVTFSGSGTHFTFLSGSEGSWSKVSNLDITQTDSSFAKYASFYGLKIGGSISNIGHFYRPGMTITAVTILDTDITDAELTAYKFPSVKTYTATFSENKSFSQLDWTPAKPAGGFGPAETLIINNTAAAKLTIDQDVDVGTFKIANTSGNALTLGFDGHSINAAFDKSAAAGGVTIDVSGDYGAKIAKYAVAGAPYSYWYVYGSGEKPNDPAVMPTLPDGYTAVAERYKDYGMRLVVTAPNTAKFGAVSVNVRGGTSETLNGSSSFGLYPVQGSDWGYQSGSGAVTKDGITFTPYISTSGFATENNVDGITSSSDSKYIFRGTCKDYDDQTTIGYTLTGLSAKYEKYRVIVYLATDSANKSFAPVKINNVTYGGPSADTAGGTTLKGLRAMKWGHTGPDHNSNGLKEGVNAVISDVLTGDTVTIRGIRKWGNGGDDATRVSMAAIQVVKVGVMSYESTLTQNCDWSKIQWTPSKPAGGFGADDRLTIDNTAANATITMDESVTVAKLTVESAAGKDLTFAPGSGSMTATSYDFSGANGKVAVGFATGNTPVKAGADTVLTSVNNPTLTIASGKKLTVKGGSLQETTTENNGTLNFEGGTAANPIVYTTKDAASNPGKMILASGTYVRMVTSNKKKGFDITGAGAAESTCEIYTSNGGQGMPSNIKFRNLTLVVSSSFKGDDALWFESTSSCVDASVNVVVNGNMKVNISGLSIGSLSGAGNIVKYGDYDGLTITPSSNAEYSGTSAVAFTIADSDYVQLISGTYTGALTVNSGATVGLKSASPSSLSVASGAHLIIGANTSSAAINVTGGTSGLNLSGVTLDIDSFEETAISESAATYKLISDSHGFSTDNMILGDSLTKGDWEVKAVNNVLQAQKKTDSHYITIDPTTGTATHDTTSRAAIDIDRAWIDEKCGTAGKSAAEVTAALNETAANGTKPWESYVLGLDPNVETSVPVIQPAQAASSNGAIAFQLSNVTVNAKAGADVTYKVVTLSAPGGSEIESSASASPGETISVALPTSGVAYYKLQVNIANQ